MTARNNKPSAAATKRCGTHPRISPRADSPGTRNTLRPSLKDPLLKDPLLKVRSSGSDRPASRDCYCPRPVTPSLYDGVRLVGAAIGLVGGVRRLQLGATDAESWSFVPRLMMTALARYERRRGRLPVLSESKNWML